MPDASTITAARTLLQAWRTELHEGYVNRSTGQVDDVDAARDIAELDQVIADLGAVPRVSDAAMVEVALNAARYCWLRNDATWKQARTILNDKPEGIDAAIDAAMATEAVRR